MPFECGSRSKLKNDAVPLLGIHIPVRWVDKERVIGTSRRQELRPHNVAGDRSVVDEMASQNTNPRDGRATGECHIELAMSKTLRLEIDANAAQSLALALVDSHGPGQCNRELDSEHSSAESSFHAGVNEFDA